MTQELTTIEDIKIPYPTEGIIRTASIDDTVTPENSAQLAVNMNFDRIGAMQTRPGVENYADELVDGINNYGTLYNSYPDGYERIIQQGPIDTFSLSFADFLSAAKIDDTHIIMFWTGPDVDGFAQVFEIGKTGGLTALDTPFEFDTTGSTWNKCIKVDDTHFLNVWTGASVYGWAQVFTFDPDTYEVSAVGSAYTFEASISSKFALAQVDVDHYICFYSGNSNTDGMATILELTGYSVGEPGNTLTFAPGDAGQNNCCALGDGEHFINTWNGKARTFTVDLGTWDISAASAIESLVIGGGGGGGDFTGGSFRGAGAGAGGLVHNPFATVAVNAYPVVVGNGGAANTAGSNSSFNGMTALGGARGGNGNQNGANGGSGSGAGANATVGGTATQTDSGGGTGYGFGGGVSDASSYGAGGGGAGEAGSNGGNPNGGDGGDGRQYDISGTPTYYAGGGGGGGPVAGNGGLGGGGNGNGSAGAANTGSGGGGGESGAGGPGGKGVVIIKAPAGYITATGGVMTTVGGFDIWTFTSSGTWTVTAVADDYAYDTPTSTYSTILPIGDQEHFLIFWRGGAAGLGKAQVINVDPTTFFITGVGTPLQFDVTANQNAAISLGDGEHFVNYWSQDDRDGFTQIFEVNPSTFAVTAVASPFPIGKVSASDVGITAVTMSPFTSFAFWVSNNTTIADRFGEMFRYTGAFVGSLLYAESGDEVYNTSDGTWTSRRSGLSEVSKARFSQFLGYIWMVNGNETIGGDPVATSNGSDFGDDLVPEDFPKGDFIQGGFEGRVWVLDRTLGVIHYTDIVQFTPPGSYSLTYDPEVNFITTISPQTGQQFTGVCQVPRALLVFTEDYIWRIYGATSIDAYPAYNVGTYSQESIIQTKTGIFFHHSSGFYQFDYGSQPVEISRRVIDFVRAIPRDYYDNIVGVYDGFDAVEWSVGRVVVEGVVFANCVMRFTISTQVWTIYDYNLIDGDDELSTNAITAMISYDDGAVLNHLMGTSEDTGGKTGAMDEGFTDFGQPFYFEYIDRWRAFTPMYAKQKSISGFNVYSENAAGANLMYQVQKSGPNAWRPLDTITEANNSLFPNASTDDFDVLRLRIAGNTKGEPVVIHGIEITELTIKGFDQN